MQTHELTGELRYRAGWRKRLVLQVQYRVQSAYSATVYYHHWRDARVEDLSQLGETVTP